MIAISEGHGDAAMTLLKAGAETDKRSVDGQLAIDMAPDAKVRHQRQRRSVTQLICHRSVVSSFRVRSVKESISKCRKSLACRSAGVPVDFVATSRSEKV